MHEYCMPIKNIYVQLRLIQITAQHIYKNTPELFWPNLVQHDFIFFLLEYEFKNSTYTTITGFTN